MQWTALARRGLVGFGLFTLTSALAHAQDGPPDPEDLDPRDGAASIPDRAAYEAMSFQGNAGRDAYLNDIQFVKFQIEGAGGDAPKLYFINTKTYQAHPRFMQAVGIGGGFGGRGGRGRGGPGGGGPGRGGPPSGEQSQEEPFQPGGAGRQVRGAIAYRPSVKAPDGTAGTYTFDFQPNDRLPVGLLVLCRDALVEKAPFLKGKLVYHPLSGGVDAARASTEAFEAAALPVYFDEDLYRNLAFLAMNRGVSFGRLRMMNLDERPEPRDIVLYETLPNTMTRVAGMITGVRQTPLSHVNLRAIQDQVPNAYVADAASHARITPLVGEWVRYEVGESGFTLRRADRAEVDAHFESLRPREPQTPPRDLSVTDVRSLADLSFADSAAFGAKTANVAALHSLDLPDGMVPNGFGVPFSFYVQFMEHNGLDAVVDAFLADVDREDEAHRKKALKDLRQKIERGSMPKELDTALEAARGAFPEGTSLRCRSSTNNEDLPGFSGAGLYDSYTHKKDEGRLSKSIQQVFASLWNLRAFDERTFFRVDHRQAAMGVLVHPNYSDERANGVAVTLDVLYQTFGFNYVNVQIGEDLVTNPEGASIPEEVLIPWQRGTDRWMQESNRVEPGTRILTEVHRNTLQKALETIHDGFAPLYGREAKDPTFAMEVEFKITADDVLAIKQARPWLFPETTEKTPTAPSTPAPRRDF